MRLSQIVTGFTGHVVCVSFVGLQKGKFLFAGYSKAAKSAKMDLGNNLLLLSNMNAQKHPAEFPSGNHILRSQCAIRYIVICNIN